ncbi:hypothetical protein LDENG_00187400 [Lucifuga dentata]|nr:hypothetical protein LDENG_00187400 [Lucifuga dentata]
MTKVDMQEAKYPNWRHCNNCQFNSTLWVMAAWKSHGSHARQKRTCQNNKNQDKNQHCRMTNYQSVSAAQGD